MHSSGPKGRTQSTVPTFAMRPAAFAKSGSWSFTLRAMEEASEVGMTKANPLPA